MLQSNPFSLAHYCLLSLWMASPGAKQCMSVTLLRSERINSFKYRNENGEIRCKHRRVIIPQESRGGKREQVNILINLCNLQLFFVGVCISINSTVVICFCFCVCMRLIT